MSMVTWIKENVILGYKILEFGSNEETTGQLVNDYLMISVVEDESVVGKYQSRYVVAPLVEYQSECLGGKNRWYDKKKIRYRISKTYAAIIVNGPKNYRHRLGFLDNIGMFNLDVPIILNDADMPHVKYLITGILKVTGKGATWLNDKTVVLK